MKYLFYVLILLLSTSLYAQNKNASIEKKIKKLEMLLEQPSSNERNAKLIQLDKELSQYAQAPITMMAEAPGSTSCQTAFVACLTAQANAIGGSASGIVSQIIEVGWRIATIYALLWEAGYGLGCYIGYLFC